MYILFKFIKRKNVNLNYFLVLYSDMIAIWIFLNVLFIVFIVEFFTYVRKNRQVKNTKEDKTHSNYDLNLNESKEILLDKYSTVKDVQIELLPGKFLIKTSNNVFIKIKDRVVIPEINLLYDINEKFTLDVINVNGEKINYFYKKI
tara:strand:+ start:2574 stop:3011 length:438 start_codon:yes stop_codon:yes gene_type:complete